MAREISGRLALVTGGARGIGLATARALAAAGCRVVVADRDAAAVAASAGPLGFAWRVLDVTDGAAFARCVGELERELGPVEVLVNNAGLLSLGPFLDQPVEDDARQLAVNLGGVLAGLRAVLPGMVARGRGHVVNVTSVAGRVGARDAAVYCASKHAVVGLSEAVRQELRGTGVELSWVLPALVRTELVSGVTPLRWPRMVEPSEVATAVVCALQTGRAETWVPREARLAVLLPALLPRTVVEWIGRALGVDRLFTRVDARARAAYQARLRG